MHFGHKSAIFSLKTTKNSDFNGSVKNFRDFKDRVFCVISKIHDFNDLDRRVNTKIRDISSLFHPSLKELNLYFNIMNVKLCLLNQEMPLFSPLTLFLVIIMVITL